MASLIKSSAKSLILPKRAAPLAGSIFDGKSTISFPFVYNAKLSNTGKLRAAIDGAKNGTARKVVAVFGDSTTFGVGSSPGSAASNALYANGPIPQLVTQLNAIGIPTKNNCFMGCAALTTANYHIYDGRVGVGLWTASVSRSIGGSVFSCATAGNQLGFTPGNGYAFDTITTIYLEPGATRSILVRANSSTVKTLLPSTGVGNTPLKDTTVIAPATTTVGYQPGSAAQVNIMGCFLYTQAETDMTLVECGWPGSVAADWDDTSFNFSAVNSIAALGADHVFIELTINDENAPTAIATYKAQIQALIDAQLATGGGVTLVVGGPTAPNPPAGTHTSLATQMTFWQAIYDLANTNDLSVLDLTIGLGSYDTMNNAGYMYDISHLTQAGYGLKASVYRDYFRQVAALAA